MRRALILAAGATLLSLAVVGAVIAIPLVTAFDRSFPAMVFRSRVRSPCCGSGSGVR